MESLEFLISHCSDADFSIGDRKVETALCAVGEDMAAGKYTFAEVEAAIKPLLDDVKIKECMDRLSFLCFYKTDFFRPSYIA